MKSSIYHNKSNRRSKLKSGNKFSATASKLVWTVVFTCLLGVSSASAQKKWHFGIGTGLTRLNAEGDLGLNLGQFGPVEMEFDLAPEDFDDLRESAIGFGGYITNGTWMVQYSIAQLKYAGSPGRSTPSIQQVTGELSYDKTTGGISVGYTVYKRGKLSIQPYVGFRYLKQELGVDLTIVGQDTVAFSKGVDNNWTDVLIGTSLNVALSKKIGWSASFDAGFGGSNGTYRVATGISWRVWKFLSLHPNAYYMAVDYENGERIDEDWYLYDADEFGWGLSFLLNF